MKSPLVSTCVLLHVELTLYNTKWIGQKCFHVILLYSFHVGCGCTNPSAYSRAIEMSHYVFEYGKTVGYDFNLLDIGGGFPGHGGSDKIFEDMSCVINGSLQKYFNNDRVTVIAEPGTYFARSPSTLVVNVVNKRLVRQEDGSQVRFEMYSVHKNNT